MRVPWLLGREAARGLRSTRRAALALLLAGALCAPSARAQPDGPSEKARTGVDLSACLLLADRNHPNIAAARARLAHVRAQLDEAHYAPFSQFRASGGVSLAPTVRGNNVYSPNTDASLTSSLGVAWRLDVSGVVPLWTFGKISNLWEAAEANVRVNEAGVEMERDAIRFDVRKAYLGLQLARDALDLLRDAQRQVDSALETLERKVASDDADPIDLLKLQTYAAELTARRSEATRFARVARAGLRFYTGVTNLNPRDEPLRPSPHRLGRLGRYLAAARVYRPEVQMARAGILAREAQLRLSRSQLFPDIGVGLSMGLSAAPEVADQINPFVSDPGNYFHYGAALVAQWKLDFLPQAARIAQAEAQLEEVVALDRKALGGVAAQVEEAYAEVVDWQTRLAAYTKASRYARQWLATVKQSIDIGTSEDRELIEPARAYAEHRYNVLNATMEYNLALAKLAKATGWDAIAPGG
jgi:outer membrane protein TolC